MRAITTLILGLALFALASPAVAGPSVGSASVSGGSGVIPDFTFQIPIPGFQRTFSLCATGASGDLECSGTAKYISAIYKWLVGFAAILAVLALTWGGGQWLISGGESGKIQEARKVIGNALIGLIIALGSYALLFTLGKQLVEYKPISIRTVREIPLNITPTTISTSGGASFTYSYGTFQAFGFPPPNTQPDPEGKKMEGETLTRWNKYKDLAATAATATKTDIGIIGMWALKENDFDTFMDNCADRDSNPNTPCPSWGSNWQVGLGIHPGNMLWAYEDAFRAMYGNSNNTTVQQVGQSVLVAARIARRPITIVSNPFPTISLNDTINSAKIGNQNSRLLLATLAKDPAIGLYLVGAHFGPKDLGANKGKLAEVMNAWRPKGAFTPQRISNLIKMIYDAK